MHHESALVCSIRCPVRISSPNPQLIQVTNICFFFSCTRFVNLLWLLPFLTMSSQVAWAWVVAAAFAFISSTWAAGDISVLAYIQDSLPEKVKDPQLNRGKEVSPLGAVMGFLYACYSIIIALTLFALGSSFRQATDPDAVRRMFIFVACIPSTVIGILIIVNSFFAKLASKDDGSLAWLPPSCCACRKKDRHHKYRSVATVELAEPLVRSSM